MCLLESGTWHGLQEMFACECRGRNILLVPIDQNEKSFFCQWQRVQHKSRAATAQTTCFMAHAAGIGQSEYEVIGNTTFVEVGQVIKSCLFVHVNGCLQFIA